MEKRWIWPFELEEQIGSGAMGLVYRARFVKNDRRVALKLLPAAFTQDTERMRLSSGIGVSVRFKLQRVRDHQGCLARLTKRQDRKDGLSFQGNPHLGSVVQRALHAAHVEIDQHGLGSSGLRRPRAS